MNEHEDPAGPVVVDGALPAFKASFVVTDLQGRPHFRGAGLGRAFGPVDVAQCVHVADHVPPEPGCSCGFHGWRHRNDAVALLTGRLVAVLEVELWGAFHEFERGFIAAAQNVKTVTLRPWCSQCPLGQEELTEPADVLIERPGGEGELVPVCEEHAPDADEVFTVNALTEALGVPVDWATPDDPVGKYWSFGRPTGPALLYRQLPGLDDLLPGEIAHVFPNAIAEDENGDLWIDPTARLIQPLPGKDIPIQLGEDGIHEIFLAGIRPGRWRVRLDRSKFALPVRTLGRDPTTANSHEKGEGPQ